MFQYLSNQIKDQVPSSKVEMADAEDHRLVPRVVDTPAFSEVSFCDPHSEEIYCFLL